MKQLLLFLLHVPLITFSWQSGINAAPKTTRGIQWTEGLSWEEVKARAKQENKYIFLDVMATWCGPCKLMDKEVYPNDTLGEYFNQHFISVKVQMDQTAADKEQIKSWYKNAAAIGRQYKVEGFPSFIFLDPQGAIVEMQSGFRPAKEMMDIAKSALQPGKVYNDPYAEYDSLVADFKRGIKKMERMPHMIQVALSLDTALARKAIKEYTDYCLTLPSTQRYNKDNLLMWSNFALSSKTRAFQFFLKDGDIMDRIMSKKGFAQEVVCRTIEKEIVWPFMKAERNNSLHMNPGPVISGPGVKADYSEANWKLLYKTIRKQYGKSNARRSVQNAKIEWYMRNRNLPAMAREQFNNLKTYSRDVTKENAGSWNSIIWYIFLYSTNKKDMTEALVWARKMIEISPNSTFMDTYANLQYKLGRREEALVWQEKAIAAAYSKTQKESLMQVLEQMQRGEPTYVNRGAIWK